MTQASVIWSVPLEEFLAVYRTPQEVVPYLRNLGVKHSVRGVLYFAKRAAYLGLPLSPLKDLIDPSVLTTVSKSRRYNNEKFLLALLLAGIEYRCELCGTRDWFGSPLNLELHHKNNVLSYNLENLMLLCPNCHACKHS